MGSRGGCGRDSGGESVFAPDSPSIPDPSGAGLLYLRRGDGASRIPRRAPGQPLKPPFPARSACSDGRRQHNLRRWPVFPGSSPAGGSVFLAIGRPGDGGTRLFSFSGQSSGPAFRACGRDLLRESFSYRPRLARGRNLKAVIQGLSSTILLPGERRAYRWIAPRCPWPGR
jgi:hypothetical protein